MKNGSSLDTRQPELVLFWYDLCVWVCGCGLHLKPISPRVTVSIQETASQLTDQLSV